MSVVNWLGGAGSEGQITATNDVMLGCAPATTEKSIPKYNRFAGMAMTRFTEPACWLLKGMAISLS